MKQVGIVAAAVLVVLMPLLGLLALAGIAQLGATATGTSGVVCAPPGAPGDPVGSFSGNQLANAGKILAAGVEVGAPQRAQVIAVATAIQESDLYMYANAGDPASLALPHDRVGSDHDSVGLFQQRAAGWGTLEQRMDPKASAKLFYARLLSLPGWASMPLAAAAQAVQSSASPDAYARWEQAANELVGAAAGITCTPDGGTPDGGSTQPIDPTAQTAITRALSQVGVPYVWGGGNAQGPTGGGFDCSGLMVFAFAGIGVSVPHQTQAIWSSFQPALTDPAALAPGDMLLFSDNAAPSGIHHVGLYLGGGRMVHAPDSGSVVQVVDGLWSNTYWTSQFIGAVRPHPAAAGPPTVRL